MVQSPASAPAPPARGPYQRAARELLRQTVLQTTQQLLSERDWSEVTMTDIATAAGMSRQTLYNEFKSRNGVAQAYVLRLVDGYVDLFGAAVSGHRNDVQGGLERGFADFLLEAASDPLVQSAIAGTAKLDVMRLVTSDGGMILDAASVRLAKIAMAAWGLRDYEAAARLGRLVVRQAMSFITLPPRPEEDPAGDLSRMLAPLIESLRAG
ncbi:TetR/AcrR family transcriptional regulator [Tomitella biformata]|uniref:TetR/AcrR family transcriptional regulator n=1 Tax=Tomitella biformata TaxID=630403 RepID=UPI000465FC33|nr:TetR family transcriptional regulator [Tomitella biformata]